MRRETGTRVIVTLLAAMLCVGMAMAGAADNAKIEGWAQDLSGAKLAQAAVTLKVPSGVDRRATTDAKGAFSFGSLAPGEYSLTIDAAGFQKTRYTNITLKDAQTRQFDFTLQPGAVSETVEIDVAHPPTLTADRGSRSLGGGNLGTTSLTTAGSISGRIRDANGSSASGVTVGVIPADFGFQSSFQQNLAFRTRTDTLGFYRLENLPSGRYFVVAGDEVFAGGTSVVDRPVFFPGVADVSRAVAVTAGFGREEIADFRLDASPVLSRSGVFRLSGQLTNQLVGIAGPLLQERSGWVGRPTGIAWGQVRVTLQPTALTLSGIDGVGLLRSAPSACRPPAQASFTSSVTSEGRFDFSVPSSVYDLCVFAQGGARAIAPGAAGSGRGGGGAWGAVAGPFSLVVDHDINSLVVDLGIR